MFKGELIKIENDSDIKKVKTAIREIIGDCIYINGKYDFNGALILTLVKAQNKFNCINLNDLSIDIKDTIKFNTDDSITITRKPNIKNMMPKLITTGIVYDNVMKIENENDIKQALKHIEEILGHNINMSVHYDDGSAQKGCFKQGNTQSKFNIDNINLCINDRVNFSCRNKIVTVTREENRTGFIKQESKEFKTCSNDKEITLEDIKDKVLIVENEYDINAIKTLIPQLVGDNIRITIEHYDDTKITHIILNNGDSDEPGVNELNLCLDDFISWNKDKNCIIISRKTDSNKNILTVDDSQYCIKCCHVNNTFTTQDRVIIVENEYDIKKAKELILRRIGENRVGLIFKQCENNKLTRITICEKEKAYFKCDIDNLDIRLFDTIDFLEDTISIIRKNTRKLNKSENIKSLVDNTKTKLQIKYNSKRTYNLDTHVFFNKVDDNLNLLSIVTRHNKKIKSELASKEVISKIIGYNNDYVLTLSQSDNYIGYIKLKNQDGCEIKEIYKSSYKIKDYILTDDNNLFILHDDFMVRILLDNNHSISIIKIEDNPIYSCNDYEINVVKK